MQLTIYFGDKPVYLCDETNEKLEELLQHPDVVFIDELSSHAINAMLHEIKKPDFHAGIILSKDFEKLQQSFFKHFIVIEAAGGIIQNEEKDILFIFRRGKWDLPKGKIEDGESAAVCAEREIEEETGVKDLTLKKELGKTYHTYNEFGKDILKISHWFYFTSENEQELIPQTSEDISEIKWFKTKDIKNPMANTYATIKNILADFFDTP